MPRHEDQFIVAGAVATPGQVVLDLGRLVVLVDAEEGDVQVVARVLEVVRIAAEERDRLLGREYQTDIRVLLVAVKVILRSLVERDDLTLELGLVGRLLLDLGDGGAAGGERLGRLHLRLDCRVDCLGDVLDRHQDVQLHAGHFLFVLLAAGVEAVLDVVLALVLADFLDGLGADVMVGHHQAIGGDKRTRAVREADR